ncbi:hypothetical protein ACJMK2_041682 [Sinanodonta woodiana]|uniref:Uncharacterized protein n=1 Tax=Sinanodonta woodiana TaxID=1069815 RepID=A0ABD3W8P3_SINWO
MNRQYILKGPDCYFTRKLDLLRVLRESCFIFSDLSRSWIFNDKVIIRKIVEQSAIDSSFYQEMLPYTTHSNLMSCNSDLSDSDCDSVKARRVRFSEDFSVDSSRERTKESPMIWRKKTGKLSSINRGNIPTGSEVFQRALKDMTCVDDGAETCPLKSKPSTPKSILKKPPSSS